MTNPRQDCCTGIEPVTPVEENNRPGLSALDYRVGRHGQFLASMLARLSSTDHPQLRAFTARDTGDLAVALLDGWSTVADVLSFYTERLANEGFLRTALDPRSVAWLGSLVGYAPRPGLGASTYLAYTVDSSAPRILIPAGSKAQNVPTGGSTPQTYETSADLIAAVDWNDLPVRMSEPTVLTHDAVSSADSVFLAGTATNLKPNDRLLFDFGPAAGVPLVKPVAAVTADAANKRTEIDFVVDTPDQAYQQAIQALVSAMAGLTGPDPIALNALDWIVAPLTTAIGTPDNPNPPSTAGPALRTALGKLADEIVVAQVHADPAADTLATVATAASDAFAAALRADPIGAAQPPIGPLDQAAPAEPAGATGANAVSGLSGLLGPLRLPPSVQPANSAALVRSASSAFAPGSDSSIGLLAAADPRLAAQLYTALSTVNLAPDPDLRAVQAMRVTAAPFGATAPPMSVTDDNGRVIGQTEWTLDLDSYVLEIDLDNPVSDFMGPTFRITYTDATGSWTATIHDGDNPTTGQVGPLTYTADRLGGVGADGESLDSVQIQVSGGPVPQRTILIAAEEDLAGQLAVTVTDGTTSQVLTLAPRGPIVTAQLAGDELRAQFIDEVFTAQVVTSAATTVTPPPTSTNAEYLWVQDLGNPADLKVLNLDAIYPGIAPGSWIIVERPTPDRATGPVQVVSVNTVAVSSYGLTGKVTQLVLAQPWLDGSDLTLGQVRKTVIRAQGDPVQIAQTPISTDIAGDTIDLAGTVNGLQTGRWLIVAGNRTDLPNATIPGGELVMLAGTQQVVDSTLPGDLVRTQLSLANSLAYTYERDSVHVYGNVVAADQGATRTEPIGSGDATATGQTFSLSSTPLTYLPADTPEGAADTLVLRVNGVQWHETDTLATAGPTDHSFVLTNGAKTTVTFGDGVHGARLPTGVENVVATYRTGLGLAGNVPAGTITQPTSRPAGVRAVNNPLPATGGADPDTGAVARANTPLATYALDRLVSTQDYADFSAARAGIGRASAQQLTDGTRDVLHLTITGVNDAPVDPSDELVRTLREALADFGDTHLPIVVAVRDLTLLVLSANIKVLPDYSWPLVEPVVRGALLDLFSPANRDLGQSAYASEALAAIQAVPGVDYIDLDVFAGVPGSISPGDLNAVTGTLTPNPVVPAALAQYQEQWQEVDSGASLTSIANAYHLSVTELVRLNPWLPNAQLPGTARPPVEIPDRLQLLVRRGIAPAQLAVLSPDVPDSLILKEITS